MASDLASADEPIGRSWKPHVKRTLVLSLYICCHTFVALVLIGATRVPAIALERMGDPLLFDTIPMRYLIDVMDLGIILTFIVFGTLSAVRVFRKE